MTSEAKQQAEAGKSREYPKQLPIVPLKSAVAFPHILVPISVEQPHSINLIDDAMKEDRLIFLVAQKNGSAERPQYEDLYNVGVIGVISRLKRNQDGSIHLIVQGLERGRLAQVLKNDPYLVGHITPEPEAITPPEETEGERIAVVNLLKKLIGLIDEFSDEVVATIESITDPSLMAAITAATVPLNVEVKQEILEADPPQAKLQRLIGGLQHEIVVREMGRKIVLDTQERMTKEQRNYFLREQLRGIQKELGDGSEQAETEHLRQRLKEAGLPDEVNKEAKKELDRLAGLPSSASDYSTIRTYLDWLASLPWNKVSGSVIDIPYSRQILDLDHYDLDKVKERILEYLAVKRLREERFAKPLSSNRYAPSQTPKDREPEEAPASREPILCFIGPPGVGKTSLGQSIAKALGRKFVRISLGGIHDEAEIRGHRRTYIGAMPGRIIQAIKRSGTRDPVVMLDEIDKVGSDWRGDPSSALLEVLDPAQNQSFTDNYLGVPFDLSQVLFITTANTQDTISSPLLDRMEVLPLSGYTDEEKIHIAEKYLIPKQIKANGLTPEEIKFTQEAVRGIIRGYTREAGVRNLDRQIAAVCRKLAREFAEGRKEPAQIGIGNLHDYLQQPLFLDEVLERTNRPGIATGLAWTASGGDVLFVEATMMSSRQEQLILTGMLGDVMRESAQAALSFIRSNPQLLNISASLFEDKTFHVHVPAGAVPKDGPSAGVTIATALASLVSGRQVRNEVAMTGEITLRGKVLPVGGIKEKVLAAHRAGIKTVILPSQNQRDLIDIPPELKDRIKFIFADTIEKVLTNALEPNDSNP